MFNSNPLLKTASRAMGQSPASTHAQAGSAVRATNAFGVPAIATRVTSITRPSATLSLYGRHAGDAIDDLIARMAADPNYNPSADDISSLGGGSTPAPDLEGLSSGMTASELTDAQRARIAAQNAQIINLASSAVRETGETIRTAITSGNEVEIARIEADARRAVANLTLQAAQAARAGNTTAAQQAAQQAANAQQLQLLMAALQGRQGGGGISTNTLLIGAAVLGGIGLIWFLTRGRGGARRNPSPEAGWPHYNPVMARQRRGKRRERKFFRPEHVGRARARGWHKVR